MAFTDFFTDLTQTGSDAAYAGIFGTTAQTLSLSANLGSLSAEGEEIVRWIRYRLGEPKITVEIDNLQIYASFEESNIEYSSIINRFTARNWISNYLGLSRNFTSEDFTNKLPHQTLDYLRRLANPYASEAGIGGVQDQRRAYVQLSTTAMDYSILTDLVDNATGSSLQDYIKSIGGARAELRRVWHEGPSSVYRYYDPYSSTNMLSQEFQYESFHNETIFYMMPIWTDVLRAGMLEMNDNVRRSTYTYNIVGDRLRILPRPTQSFKTWVDYTVKMNTLQPDYAVDTGDPSITGISNISNIPLKDIKYEDLSSHGKRWVRQYCLAVCMETLGRIRRKYSSIPVPNNEVTLDGDALVAEGQERQEQLKESLTDELNETSNVEMMRLDAELSESIEQQLARIPFPTPIYSLG